MTSKLLRLCCATLLGLPLLAALPAHAQYSYIDEHGTRVFSDQPPPPGTPAKRILKTPRAALPPAQETPSAPAEKAVDPKAPGAKPAAPKGPPTLAEREADFAKRAKARQDEETKKAEDQAKQNARDCPALLNNEAQLTSGRRTTRINPAGQAEFVPDEDRDRMIAEARRAAARCR